MGLLLMVGLLVGCFVGSAGAQQQKLGPEAFVQVFVDVLKEAEPAAVCKQVGGMALEISLPGKEVMEANLENAYAQYLISEDSAEEALTNYVAVALQILHQEKTPALVIADVLPVIKPQEYLDELLGRGLAPLHEPLGPEGLYILYVQDTPASARTLMAADLEALGLELAELRPLATQNLLAVTQDWVIEPLEDGVAILQGNGMYEASLLALDAQEALLSEYPVEGELLVSVPSREIFLLGDSANPKAQELLSYYGEMVFQQTGYPVTLNVLVWQDGTYEYWVKP